MQAPVVRAYIFMVLATMMAASGWMFSLHALEGLPPLLFIGVRFMLAGLVVGTVAAACENRPSWRDLMVASAPGVLLALAMLLWILGLSVAGNIGVGAFICSLGSILAPFAGRIVFKWPVAPATRLAAAIAVCGLALLLVKGGIAPRSADLLFLASAVASSLAFVANARLAASIPVLLLTAVQLEVAGVVNFAASAIWEVWPAWPYASATTVGWLLASVFIATSVRYFLQLKAQGAGPVGDMALLMCLEPVWTSAFAKLWLGTGMSVGQFIGCALVLSALLVNGWPRHNVSASRFSTGEMSVADVVKSV